MPAAGSARSAPPALTDADVADLRAQLESGATPRVRLRAGGTGAVIDIGNPDADGPEYIKVKVTLNGTRDTLPFAPDDLAATPRRVPPAAANASRTASTATASPPSSPPAAAPSPTAKARAGRRPRRNLPPRTAPDVLITLRTAGAEWTVDAARDGTTITTGAVVSAEAVQAVADNLHDAKLAAAVADVSAVRRADAAGRVERLRAELTAAEALLASYTPGSPADHVGGRTAG